MSNEIKIKVPESFVVKAVVDMGFTIGYLRQDDDCHWYTVPYDKIEEFDNLMDKMYENARNGDYETEFEFNDRFGKYTVGGSLNNIKIIMETK